MAQRKTIDQQIAEAELRLKRLKSEKSQRERKERTRRLIASAAKIEADAGITIDAQWATEIAHAINDGRVALPSDSDSASGTEANEASGWPL